MKGVKAMWFVRTNNFNNSRASFVLDRGKWGWLVADRQSLSLLIEYYQQGGVSYEIIEGINPDTLVYYKWEDADQFVSAPYLVLKEWGFPQLDEHMLNILRRAVEDRMIYHFPLPQRYKAGEMELKAEKRELLSPIGEPTGFEGIFIDSPYAAVMNSRPSRWYERLQWGGVDGDVERLLATHGVDRAIRKALIRQWKLWRQPNRRAGAKEVRRA